MTNSARPWQGTTLAVFNIIGVVFSFLFAIIFLFAQGMISSYLTSVPVGMEAVEGTAQASAAMSMISGMGIGFALLFILSAVLGIFMARGALKGQKWSPMVSLIFAALGVLGALVSMEIVSLAINGLIAYCGYICIKHPFYNAGKVAAPAEAAPQTGEAPPPPPAAE